MSSATAASPVAAAMAAAFSRAFSSRVVPVSSTSGTPAGRGARSSSGTAAARMAVISAALSGLAEARTSFTAP